jgi:hypothetical protein
MLHHYVKLVHGYQFFENTQPLSSLNLEEGRGDVGSCAIYAAFQEVY